MIPSGEPRLDPIGDEHYDDCPACEDWDMECICAELESAEADSRADEFYHNRKEEGR